VTRFETWFQHTSNALVGGTGLVYGWMRYFAEPSDSFAVTNHPLQSDVHHLHILTAPLLIFACGLIWPRHVWPRVRSSFAARRPTGLALAASLLPMILSGYAVQVSVDDTWQLVWIWVHVVTSSLWILGYLVHQLSARSKTIILNEE